MRLPFGLLLLLQGTVAHQLHQPFSNDVEENSEMADLIAKIYAGETGWATSPDDKDRLGGTAELTYGEVTTASMEAVLRVANPVPGEVFYDLGSGIGKVVIQSFLSFNLSKIVGVEISSMRYKQACDALKRASTVFEERSYPNLDSVRASSHHPKLLAFTSAANRSVEFVNANFLDVDFSDADIVYVCSTCFGDDLLEELVKRFQQLKVGARVISHRNLPTTGAAAGLQQVFEGLYRTSWSNATYVHSYVRPGAMQMAGSLVPGTALLETMASDQDEVGRADLVLRTYVKQKPPIPAAALHTFLDTGNPRSPPQTCVYNY